MDRPKPPRTGRPAIPFAILTTGEVVARSHCLDPSCAQLGGSLAQGACPHRDCLNRTALEWGSVARPVPELPRRPFDPDD